MAQRYSIQSTDRMRTLWLTYRWTVPAAVAVVVAAAIIIAVVVLRAGKPRPDWCAIKDRIASETTSGILAVNPPAGAPRAAVDGPAERRFCPRNPMRCCPDP